MNQTNMPSELIIFILIFFLIYYIYMSFCLMKIAKKANLENGWLAWIPIFDMLLAIQIAKKPIWWIMWFFIPFANIIIYVLIWMGICETLRKPQWLGILMIISPINLIIPGYLAFSKINNTPQKPQIKIVNVSL